MPGIARLIHPAPALTVVALSLSLGAILAGQSGIEPLSLRLALTTVAVAGSQVLTGALNDWADRDRDARVQPTKPIPSGVVTPRTALAVAAAGASVQLIASVPLGWLPLLLGAIASGSAVAYNLWLSRTPFSVVPYLVSFCVLPIRIAAGTGVPSSGSPPRRCFGRSAAAAHLAISSATSTPIVNRPANLAHLVGMRVTHAAAVVGRSGWRLGWTWCSPPPANAPRRRSRSAPSGAAVPVLGAGPTRRTWGGILWRRRPAPSPAP